MSIKGLTGIGVIAMVLGGCVETRVVSDTWATLRDLSDQSKSQGATQATASAGRAYDRPTWAIELASFSDKKQTAAAEHYARDLHQKTNMPDLWVDADDDKTYVYRGWYLDPGGISGKSDLRQTRMIRVDNQPRFKNASMVRVDERHSEPDRGTGVTRSMNLKRYGGKDLYSLQIGVYDDLYGKNFHEACELRVAALNKLGEQAYYYHTEHKSMITLGLYNHDIAFTAVRVQMPGSETAAWQDQYSPFIRGLQKKHPHNVYNGQAESTDKNGDPVTLNSSLLVRVQ